MSGLSLILVGVDGSKNGYSAFKRAVALANQTQATVQVVQVIENRIYGIIGSSEINPKIIEAATKKSQDMMDEYIQYAHERHCERIYTAQEYGTPKELLAKDLIIKYQPDLLILGQSGIDMVERTMLGSVSEYASKNAQCDVLIVQA